VGLTACPFDCAQAGFIGVTAQVQNFSSGFVPEYFAFLFQLKWHTFRNGQADSGPAFEDNVKLRRVVWTLSICLMLAVHGNAQSQNRPANPAAQGSQAPTHIPTDAVPGTTPDEAQERMVREMAKRANLERHAALKSDTERLLKLAEELKTSVDKSSASVLSLEVLKKAEEIEKLARSVKDKMKGPN